MPAATMMTNTGSDNFNQGFGNGLSLYDEYEINMKDGDKLSEYETVRFELIELYTEYAPHKLKNVDKMLSKYQGQEIELLNAAKSKYVPSNSDNGHKNNENAIPPSTKDSSPTTSSSANRNRRQQRRSSLGGYLIKGGDLTHSSSSHSISSASSASSAGRSGGERSSNRSRVGRRGSIGGSRSHPDSLSSLSHGNHHHNPRTSTSSRQRRASIGGGGGGVAAERRTCNRRQQQRASIQKALEVALQQDNDEDMSEHSNATDCSGPSISRSTSRSSTTRRRGSLGGLDVSGHSKSSSTEYQLSPKSSRKSRPSATTTNRRRGSSSGLDASEHSKSSLTEQQPSSNNNKPPSSHHRSSRTHRRSSIGGCGGGGGGAARRRGSISCTNETWDIQVGTIDDSKAIHKVALRF